MKTQNIQVTLTLTPEQLPALLNAQPPAPQPTPAPMPQTVAPASAPQNPPTFARQGIGRQMPAGAPRRPLPVRALGGRRSGGRPRLDAAPANSSRDGQAGQDD